MNSSSLCEALPYWEFESRESLDHMILWDGSLVSGIEITPQDIDCFDADKINHLALNLRTFINSLPEKMTAQFFLSVETDFGTLLTEHAALCKTDLPFLNFLDAERIQKLSEEIQREEVFRPRVFLFLKTESLQTENTFSFKSATKFSVRFGEDFTGALQTLIQVSESSRIALGSAGFSPNQLSKSQLITLVYKYLNPRRSKETGAPAIANSFDCLENQSPRSQLVFGDLVLDQEDFILDRTRTRVLTLKTLPEVTYAGMMSLFLSMDFKYELMLSFHIPDQNKEVRALEQKRRMAHSLTSQNNGRVSDLEGESRLKQTTDLIREIIDTGQKVFVAELVVILREENSKLGRSALNLHTKEVLSRFRMLSGAEGIQETVGAWQIFSNELVGSPMKLIRGKKMKSNNLADFLPLYGGVGGDPRPMIITHTKTGSLFAIDPYDTKLTNYNMLVTGSSGTGKSFLNNFLMLQQIARGVKVFIIDIGGSYKKLTELMGGQYFEVNLSQDYALNPFAQIDPSVRPSGERIKALVNIIEQMIADEGEKLTRFDRVLIEEALTTVFEEIRKKTPLRSPQISDFAKHCERSKEESLRRVAKLLYPWIGDSAYGKLIDRQGVIRADSPVVAFDLKGLSQYPDLQSVMTLILTNFILDQVEQNKEVPKRILLDEAWELLKSKAASSFMEYAARTLRKTGAGITFITQGVEEIVQSAVGSAILNNTATKLILMQQGDTKVLKETLHLNGQETRIVETLQRKKGVFSEAFLMKGDTREVLRIGPSPVEYWIATSDSSDNVFLRQLMSEGLDLKNAILRAANEAPYGIESASLRRPA